jgi:hypothetical protein
LVRYQLTHDVRGGDGRQRFVNLCDDEPCERLTITSDDRNEHVPDDAPDFARQCIAQ